ncbi:phage major capsid protein, P2 family [Salmonella enterica]|uniref:phage major capsid protein, P2 family n=1 Tax=Salmonella enterica TaxID=28901 RepID=UPI0019E778B8|nr:phage major capsid protein, P2 family [Salmonella enterica]EIW3597299.1 phage major capsid protein, P2 family [Salmonella enterica]HAO3763892.1 phage major capsid protein, P2 family [Salmonella enterica]
MAAQMLSTTAAKYLQNYAIEMAKKNNVLTARDYFSIQPPRETMLRNALLQNADPFMSQITIMLVEQLIGQVVTTGIPGLYTGRTKEGRFNKALGVEGNEYRLYEVDSGSFLDYATLTSWANAGTENEFYNRIQAFFYKSISNDLLRVALNGTSASDNTDPVAHPNGEDIHPGWHQIVKERTPKQIITDKVVLNRAGTGADFTSIDALAADAINNCIPPEFRNHPDLVVLVSQNVIAADVVSMLNRIDRPTEKVAAQIINREIAGRRSISPPFMPDNRLIVTMPWNLHLYFQSGTQQRKSGWIDDRKRFENNWLRMEGCAVEYDELYGSFDNIELAGLPHHEPGVKADAQPGTAA